MGGCSFPASADNLCSAGLAATDIAGRLFVPDWEHNRVLAYDTPLTSSSADRELGQLDFVHSDVNFPGARSLSYPSAVTVDNAGHLYLTDGNRVLGWASATGLSNGQPADLVIGQADFYSTGCELLGPFVCPAFLSCKGGGPRKFNRKSPRMCSPQGLAADSAGNLFVSDTMNNRVMIYTNPFSACAGKFPCIGAAPSAIVDGKGDAFVCRKPGAGTLCSPEQLAIDPSGNLWLADSGNSRVLMFPRPISSLKIHPDASSRLVQLKAALVIGQGSDGRNFDSRKCNNGDRSNPIPSADTLCDPNGIALDGNGNLYVSDSVNGRLLEYDDPLSRTPGTPGVPGSAGDVTADRAFDAGGSFTMRNCGETADQLCTPEQMAVDSHNNLYATDGNRVLEYLDPTAGGGGTPGSPGSPGDTTADFVYGQQGSFTSNFCDGNQDWTVVNATTLCQAGAVTVDGAGNVFIADSGNFRLLGFSAPTAGAGAR